MFNVYTVEVYQRYQSHAQTLVAFNLEELAASVAMRLQAVDKAFVVDTSHEERIAAYRKIVPDEYLAIPGGWDGLTCSGLIFSVSNLLVLSIADYNEMSGKS